jgi:hypothetical protein
MAVATAWFGDSPEARVLVDVAHPATVLLAGSYAGGNFSVVSAQLPA